MRAGPSIAVDRQERETVSRTAGPTLPGIIYTTSHPHTITPSQVQQMQVGFQTLGRGGPQTRSWGRLTSPPSAHHARSDSAPIRSPSPSSSSPENSLPPLSEVSPEPACAPLRKKTQLSSAVPEREHDGYRSSVYTPELGASAFHDPLSKYHGTGKEVDLAHSSADHRLSVAW